MRLVFRLVDDQLHRSDDAVLRVDTGQDEALVAPYAFSDAAPERTSLIQTKGKHKADGCPAAHTVFEDRGQRIKMGENVVSGEVFNLQ